ncbi:Cell division control protein 48 like C [Dendrobium catenatum]|uniref:Cell division control protein 48 like C n=1 Tax=Dendrobium catenatum TaxID=906689 RepID=A0A2I0X1X3_9ASPA|nr:Cell division control protein 48 like C [Dendrobium catenatum]
MMQLMTCMDESQQILRVMDSDYGQEAYEKIIDRMSSYVLVIGATSRPDAIDQALRKPGRFDRDIALGVTDVDARTKILSVLTRNVRIEGKFDRFKIDRLTPDFVGADLARLVSKARNLAIKRIIDKRPQLGENVDWWRHLWLPEEIENLSITMFNFELLIKLDGVDQRHSVYVIGATNRLEVIDPVILQPGRFGRLFYVPLPSVDEQEACKNLTRADLTALVNEAAMTAKEEKQMHVDQGISYDKPLVIKTSHFEKALEKIIPSVSEKY